VLWWDANVRDAHRPEITRRKTGELSEEQAEALCKFMHQRISEWRARLARQGANRYSAVVVIRQDFRVNL
jgi:hypothetical protein